MTIRMLALAAAALTCLSSVAHAEHREPVTARVSFAGLDLSSIEGRRMLDARIDSAARRVCTSPVTGLRGFADTRRCRAEMKRDAQIRVAQIARPMTVASVR